VKDFLSVSENGVSYFTHSWDVGGRAGGGGSVDKAGVTPRLSELEYFASVSV
jgi:hypothetical protein